MLSTSCSHDTGYYHHHFIPQDIWAVSLVWFPHGTVWLGLSSEHVPSHGVPPRGIGVFASLYASTDPSSPRCWSLQLSRPEGDLTHAYANGTLRWHLSTQPPVICLVFLSSFYLPSVVYWCNTACIHVKYIYVPVCAFSAIFTQLLGGLI